MRFGHDIAAQRVARGLALWLGHDGAAQRVTGALSAGVLGARVGRHVEERKALKL